MKFYVKRFTITLRMEDFMEKTDFIKLKKLSHIEYKEDLFREIKRYNHDNVYHRSLIISALIHTMKKYDFTNLDQLYSYVMDRELEEITKEKLLEGIEKYDKEINKLINKYSIDEVKSYLFFGYDTVFSKVHENTTPIGIIDLVVELLEIDDGDRIMNLYSGIGDFILEVYQEGADNSYYGVEDIKNNYIVSSLRKYILNMDVEYLLEDPLRLQYNQKYDKIFSNYPLNGNYTQVYSQVNRRLERYKILLNQKRNVSADWIYNLAIMDALSDEGRAIVVMSNSGIWNDSDREVRRFFIENGFVEGVITLPEKLYSMYNMPVSLLILSHGNDKLRLLDAGEIFTAERRLNVLNNKDVEEIIFNYYNETSLSTVMDYEYIDSDYNLSPRAYINQSEARTGDIKIDSLITSIKRGASITSREIDELSTGRDSKHKYLMIQNINDGLIDDKLLNLTRIDEEYSKFIIEENDILLSKNGSPFKVALAENIKDKKILANGNLYIIKVDKTKAQAHYIKAYLESDEGQKRLEDLSKGSSIKNISMKDFKGLYIPKLSLEDQELFVEEYIRTNKEIVRLKRKLAEKLDNRNDLIDKYVQF